ILALFISFLLGTPLACWVALILCLISAVNAPQPRFLFLGLAVLSLVMAHAGFSITSVFKGQM
ncbi:hypothetical protein KIPB_012787, partial [Kipferlia bialata]